MTTNLFNDIKNETCVGSINWLDSTHSAKKGQTKRPNDQFNCRNGRKKHD